MKKSILFLVLLSFAIFSCEKTDVKPSNYVSENGEYERPEQEPEFFRASACVAKVEGVDKLGARCIASTWKEEICPKATDCSPVCDGIVGGHFTDDEMNEWLEGSYDFEMTSEYINEHYDFFLYLHEELEMTYHPDIIIENLLQIEE